VAHAVDLLVDRRILRDVGIRRRDVGFGLMIVVSRKRSTRPRCPGRVPSFP
jgi:hypothetical protein